MASRATVKLLSRGMGKSTGKTVAQVIKHLFHGYLGEQSISCPSVPRATVFQGVSIPIPRDKFDCSPRNHGINVYCCLFYMQTESNRDLPCVLYNKYKDA